MGKKNAGVNEAISQLAKLFDYGLVMADTEPARFLNQVTEEIKSLRRDKRNANRDLLYACKTALPFLKDYLRGMDMNTRDGNFLKMENMIVVMGKVVITAREG